MGEKGIFVIFNVLKLEQPQTSGFLEKLKTGLC